MPVRRRSAHFCAIILSTALASGSLAVWPASHAVARDTQPSIQPAAPAPAPATVSATSADSAVRATLPNGLQVIIIRDRLAPVVTTEMNYLTGSAEAPDGFPGTAHALEHMMFRGSTGLDRDQLSAIGARLGGNYNADTTENVTQYFYTAPSEDLGVMLHIEALRMRGLTLSQADWDKERGAIEQEVSRDLSSPAYRYMSQLQAILFENTPYAHDALGTRPSFDKTDARLLREFYDKWYAPNNAILVIAGDVDPDEALARVRDNFAAIPSRTLPERATVTPGPLKAQTLALPTDYPIGLVTLAWRMPGLKSKDFAASDILSDVLASKRGALYDLVPQGKALYASFETAPKSLAGVGIAIGAFPTGSDPAPLIAEMRGIIASIRKNGVPEDLVEAGKRKEIAQLGFAANSVSGLAERWSQALAFMGLNAPDDLAAAYAAVTPEDVNRLAQQILDPDQAVTAVLTPTQSGKPVEGKGFGGAESFASSSDKPVKLPQWASDALSRLDLPAPTAQPSVFTLANGLRLIVLPSQVSHTISVNGSIRQSDYMQEPAGKEGVADLTEGLFSYGSATYDRLGLQKALDDIAARESAGANFSLDVLTPDFERGMALLADNELAPSFPARALAVVRQQQAQSQAGELTSPDYLFGRAISRAVSPPHDPSLREATPATISKLTDRDVRAFYAAAYRPDLTTIVITGDITPDAARAVVEKTFGAWKAKGPKPAVDLPRRPDSRTSQSHVPDPGTLQDSVTLAQSIGLTAANPDHFMLNVGNEILAGGFSSRFYQDLRVKTGYVYSVSGRFSWLRNRAGYSISFGADPDKVGRARDAALHDLKEMQDRPVSEQELTMAKAALLRSLPLQRASLSAIAEEYLYLDDLGLPLNNPDLAARAYFDATPEAIQHSFRTWIRPADMAEIVKGPAPTN